MNERKQKAKAEGNSEGREVMEERTRENER